MARKARRSSRFNAPPARLVGYCRVSTDDQAERGLSLDAQAERLRAHARAIGAELVAVEQDPGVSGFKPPLDRPGFLRAFELVRAGEADGIAAVALDRLSRNAISTMLLIEQAEAEGWRLVALDLALDTGTPTGRLTAHVMAAIAQLYRDQISEKTSLALDAILREGRSRSRWTPFGYRTAEGGIETRTGDREPLVEHAGEQRILRQIGRLREQGLGARRIARALGVHPRTGKPWHPATVQSIVATLERRADALAA